MRGRWDEFSLAALALCLGCGSAEGDGTPASGGAANTSTTSTTSNGSGGTGAGSGNTAAGSGETGTTASSTATTAAAGAGGQPPLPRTETHACLEYILGFCEYTARCGGESNVTACFERNGASCPDLVFAPGSSRTVDGTFACADEWRALGCELVTPECATAGTLADGEACISGIQCASRLCSVGESACGSCLPSAELGEACDDALGPQCTPGLGCDPTALVCVALETGAGVNPLEIGDECDPTRSDCSPNDCRLDDAAVYRCQPYPTLGQDCSDPLTCAFGDSYCDITQVCLALPAAGESCGVDAFTGLAQWCADGAFCDRNQYPALCVATPGLGEPCDGACQEDLGCNCTDDACATRVCQRPRFHGQSCAVPEDTCILGECLAGSCVVPEAESNFAERCGE